MRIGDRQIGREHEPYVIAEIGVNHDGSVDRALELVDAAAEAGADAVKLQLFRTDQLMSRAAKLAAYQEAAGESDPLAMLRRLELSPEACARVAERARERGVHAIASVFSLEMVEEAGRVGGTGFDAYKTASPDVVNLPLLQALAQLGRPLIVSTGTSTLEEVAEAVRALRRISDRLAVLQCVSSYPTPEAHAALGGIRALLALHGTVGYSDHTDLIETGGLAVAAGACILEKHLTYSRSAAGPDHAASLEPDGFRRYVAWARRAFRMLGPESKRVLEIEGDVRGVSRQSIVTTRALPAGHLLRREDLTIKRPGGGLEPRRLEATVGRRLARAVEADAPLVPEDLEGEAAAVEL